MQTYDYIIIGGGMTADAAVEGIRERDQKASIAVFSDESQPPYNRPPLSKKLWTGKPLDSIWRRHAMQDAEIYLNTYITSGDSTSKVVTDQAGNQYKYGKLLLATGGSPRHLPNAPDGIIYFRTLDDYMQTRKLADRHASFLVIGGGFIGSEIAAALSMNGCQVTMLFPDHGIGTRVYPSALSTYLLEYFKEKGIKLMPGERVQSITHASAQYTVTTESGKYASADAVIAGLGIVLNLDLAKSLGVKIDNGIIVDNQLRTSVPDIFAAGDVANFYSEVLAIRRRVEHEDNANTMGAMAGRNMAGAGEIYEYLPYFYSDLFDLGYEAVGEFGTGMDIVEDWQESFRKGVVYYLRQAKVRGVLLWNTWGQVDAARKLITSNHAVTPEQLKSYIHD